jgi:glycerol-3-phosphate dehydrogenase subunit C
MAYSLLSKDYWNDASCDKEMHRVIDICNGCRLCDALCPSFNIMFDRIDEEDAKATELSYNPVDGLTKQDYHTIVDNCNQCKLCYPKCPYTKEAAHAYDLDVPRLFMREKAIRVKTKGLSLRDKFIGNTDLLGKIGSLVPWLMNFANQNKLNRILTEKVFGIHRLKLLPTYTSQTATKIFNRLKRTVSQPKAKVAIFFSCPVNYNNPEVSQAIIEVYQKNDIEISLPSQECCGMPHLGGPDYDMARVKGEKLIASLKTYILKGYDVVIPSPSCSLMVRKEYAELFVGTPIEADAKLVASKTYDTSEYLVKLAKEGKLNRDFKKSFGKIIYHLPCHLHAQSIGNKSKDMMELIPNTKVETVQKCAGVDGTWGMKTEYFQISLEIGNKLFTRFEKAATEDKATPVSDCTLAAMQIEQGTNASVGRPKHPMQIMHEAYGLDKN